MMAKFENSWRLFKASISVTFKYRKLLWFPILITFLTVFIALFFLSAMVIPAVAAHHWLALNKYLAPTPAVGAAYALCVPLVYLLSMLLATFFNVAFYSEIIAALNGKGVSFRRGLASAYGRLPSIVVWSLFAGLVGWLIRSLEARLPFAARIFTGFIGLAWSIAAVFAIPVIIQEQPMRNPLKILQQSAMTLKKAWGESLVGYVGFSAAELAIFLCSLPPFLLAGALAYLFKSVWLIAIAAAIWLLGLLVMTYISGVAGNVYRCALYLYAAEGVIPEPYDREMLDMAWKVKKA
ncbi:MAG: DUF6159 family protein [Limisphaerales bacterium]